MTDEQIYALSNAHRFYDGRVDPLSFALAILQAATRDAVDAQRYRQLRKSGAIIAWAHVGPWVYGEAIDAEMDKWIAASAPKGDGND